MELINARAPGVALMPEKEKRKRENQKTKYFPKIKRNESESQPAV